MSNSTFTISGGDFRGANVFQGSILTNVASIAATMPAPPDARGELTRTISELNAALALLPAERANDANAIAKTAESLVAEAAKPDANPTLLRTFGEALKNVALTVKDAAPVVITLAVQAVDLIAKIKGL